RARLFNKVRQTYDCLYRRPPLGKSKQLLGQILRASADIQHDIQSFQVFVAVRPVLHAKRKICNNAGQDIIEIMRNAAGRTRLRLL
ncbi:MAG: hypothetical protein OEV28_14020, partial [Nitrospirota bacterium]|nr:hypothetical protein [Nitrospirota bacterium]